MSSAHGKIVPPSGTSACLIAVVGARPGHDEVYSGRPFSGPSGELLWRLFGASRSEMWVTNVRKDFSDTHSVPTPAEIDEVLPALRDELARTTANIFVAIGAQALYALTGKASIEAWRGSVLPCSLVPGRKVLGSFHTAAALRDWPITYIIERDLRKVRRESFFNDIRYPKREFVIDATLEQTVEYLNGLGDPISVDIETIGMETIACVGISDDPGRAICIPFIGGRLSPSELAYVWRRLDNLFRTRGIIGQNIQFDLTRLERYGFRFPRIHFDTMLAHHLLYPEFDHDLGFIVSVYTNEPYYKHEISTQLWPYNCKDAACTYEVYLGLLKELKQSDQETYFNEHVMSLIRPIMQMQAEGFVIDQVALRATRARLELEREYLQLQLNQTVGFDINVKSGPDLRRLLHDELRLPKLKYTRTGLPSTDEDTLRKLSYDSVNHAHIFRQILDIRERRTMLSGFLNLETDDHGRYRADYLIHGTKTGRLSSRGRGQGPQLQNIPMRARKMFVAAPGHVLIQGDLKRAEAMFVAFDSQSPSLQKLYTDAAINPYCEFASRTLNKRVTKEDELVYKTFKTVTHASNYGMAWKKLIIILRLAGINVDDLELRGLWGAKKKAEFLIESYHALAPELRTTWHPRIRSILRATRCLHDAFGRRRLFLDRMDEELFRKGYAHRPQASIVNVANQGVRRLVQEGYRVVAQVHDSIVNEVPEEDVHAALVALNKAMTTPVETWGGTITIPVELKIGYSWGNLHEIQIHEPDTIREVLGKGREDTERVLAMEGSNEQVGARILQSRTQ
jgi:uracil-DNA glycosylase family 4